MGWLAVVSKCGEPSDQLRGVIYLKKWSICYTAAQTSKIAERWEFVRYQMGCELIIQLTSGMYVEIM